MSALFNILARHNHRKLLGHQLSFALAANARRINEANFAAFVLDDLINRISRSAGHRRNNRAIDSRKLIQQRGFPDIRMPDDGNFNFMRRKLVSRRLVVSVRVVAFLCAFRRLPQRSLWLKALALPAA